MKMIIHGVSDPDCLVRRPHHKWFSAPATYGGEHNWIGPCDTIRDAISLCVERCGPDMRIYLGQGYKTSPEARRVWGYPDLEWIVCVGQAFSIEIVDKIGGTPEGEI